MPMHYLGTPVLVGAGETVDFDSSGIIGFICTTAGDITISKRDANGVTTVIDGFGAAADTYVDLPIIIGSGQGRIVSGTAVGVLITR